MTIERAPRTLRPFVYLNDTERERQLKFSQRQGHCMILLHLLKKKEQWTSREVREELEKLPYFRTRTSSLRAVNWWLWKFKQAGLIEWLDEIKIPKST